ncbi:hypothetical protein GGR50DRAFT_581983 [Xylaria sp. CBS 124048]|nr:hypothetical protein GGR50DRAFT_581983 [Xylaria sp. CBS 124048]
MSVNKPLQQPPMATATDPQRPQQQRAPSLSALSEISSTSTHISSFPFPLPSSFGPHPTSAEAATAAAVAADPPLPLSPLARSPVSVTSARDTKGPNKGRSSISAAQPIRRKPLSSTASSIATRYSSGQYLATLATSLPRPEQGYDRSFSVASSTDYKFPQPPLGPMSRRSHWEFTAEPTDTGTGDTVSTHDHDGGTSPEHQLPHSSPLRHGIPVAGAAEVPPPDSGDIDHASSHAALSHPDQSQALYDDLYPDEDQDQDQDEDASSDHILDGYNSDNSSDNANSSPVNENTMPLQVPRKHIPHHLTINPNQARRGSASNDPKTGNSDKPLPKSPGSSRLGSFFGWAPSPTTEYSEKTYSPLASPFARSKSISQSDASPLITTGPQSSYEAAKAELSTSGSLDYSDSYLATPSARSTDPSELDEMEDELKAISAELASSIRREIDLEDMVEKLQAEKDNTAAATGNKRTSDYYSDSGYSSAKFSEYDQSREEVEKIQRRSELEKAQLRLELTTKLQDERLRRQKMDEQIRDLSTKASQLDIAAMNNADASTRIKE